MSRTGVEHNIGDLNDALHLYQQYSRLSIDDILKKQGAKLGWAIRQSLAKTKKPSKGIIRQIVIDRLRSGKFIKIRQSVIDRVEKRRGGVAGKTGKGTSGRTRSFTLTKQQELVEREIRVRESGRGVMSVSSRYSGKLKGDNVAGSKYGMELSHAVVRTQNTYGIAQFVWAGVNKQAKPIAEGLTREPGRSAVRDAIAFTTADILLYVKRKQMEVMNRAAARFVKRMGIP